MEKAPHLNAPELTRRYPLHGKFASERRNLVTSFGLCWSRKRARFDESGTKTMWGHGSRPGFGDLRIDFWTYQGAYILYADPRGNEPVYVGVAVKGGLGTRLDAHASGKEMVEGWTHFSWFSSGPVLDDLGYRLRRSSAPRWALPVNEGRIWLDFEAVIYRAFNREIKNRRHPIFGGSSLEFYQDPTKGRPTRLLR